MRDWTDTEHANGRAEHEATVFVENQFNAVLRDAPDGGIALCRLLVARIFSDMAHHDAAGDMCSEPQSSAVGIAIIGRPCPK